MSVDVHATLAEQVAAMLARVLTMVPAGLQRSRAEDVCLQVTALVHEADDQQRRAIELIEEEHEAELDAVRVGEEEG